MKTNLSNDSFEFLKLGEELSTISKKELVLRKLATYLNKYQMVTEVSSDFLTKANLQDEAWNTVLKKLKEITGKTYKVSELPVTDGGNIKCLYEEMNPQKVYELSKKIYDDAQ